MYNNRVKKTKIILVSKTKNVRIFPEKPQIRMDMDLHKIWYIIPCQKNTTTLRKKPNDTDRWSNYIITKKSLKGQLKLRGHLVVARSHHGDGISIQTKCPSGQWFSPPFTVTL